MQIPFNFFSLYTSCAPPGGHAPHFGNHWSRNYDATMDHLYNTNKLFIMYILFNFFAILQNVMWYLSHCPWHNWHLQFCPKYQAFSHGTTYGEIYINCHSCYYIHYLIVCFCPFAVSHCFCDMEFFPYAILLAHFF
jgi:hypothetical protein